MGEKFKRNKAAAFRHQQDVRYDNFRAADLFSEARGAVLQSEYDAAFVAANEGAPAGATVLLRVEADGSVGVVHGPGRSGGRWIRRDGSPPRGGRGTRGARERRGRSAKPLHARRMYPRSPSLPRDERTRLGEAPADGEKARFVPGKGLELRSKDGRFALATSLRFGFMYMKPAT